MWGVFCDDDFHSGLWGWEETLFLEASIVGGIAHS